MNIMFSYLEVVVILGLGIEIFQVYECACNLLISLMHYLIMPFYDYVRQSTLGVIPMNSCCDA